MWKLRTSRIYAGQLDHPEYTQLIIITQITAERTSSKRLRSEDWTLSLSGSTRKVEIICEKSMSWTPSWRRLKKSSKWPALTRCVLRSYPRVTCRRLPDSRHNLKLLIWNLKASYHRDPRTPSCATSLTLYPISMLSVLRLSSLSSWLKPLPCSSFSCRRRNLLPIEWRHFSLTNKGTILTPKSPSMSFDRNLKASASNLRRVPNSHDSLSSHLLQERSSLTNSRNVFQVTLCQSFRSWLAHTICTGKKGPPTMTIPISCRKSTWRSWWSRISVATEKL